MRRDRSIRSRRKRKRVSQLFDLQLTSMLDILVIILVFLLKSVSTSTSNFSLAKGVELPISMSEEVPPDTLQIIINEQAITFEQDLVAQLVSTRDQKASQIRSQDLAKDQMKITALYNILVKARQKAEYLRAKSQARDSSGKPLPFEGVLAIQAHKKTSYETIQKVLYTAALADYKLFRFLAQRK